MGYLLKEALKTLCGVNQWAYAVFWKIGCQNPKLLIWEECYYEPPTFSSRTQITGSNPSEGPFGGLKVDDRIQLLINKMMNNNQISILGEGIIGRAAFTGNHEWILLNSYSGQTHPPEVSKDLLHQFAAGVQTVAVIPVPPHGVVQLGSSLAIMENVGFVNDVKSLILQLACIPGALFSLSLDRKAGVQGFPGAPTINQAGHFQANGSDPLVSNSCKVMCSSSHACRLVGRPSPSIIDMRENPSTPAPEIQTLSETVSPAESYNHSYKQRIASFTKTTLPLRSGVEPANGLARAEVIPANIDAWLNRQTASSSLRCDMRYQATLGQPHGKSSIFEPVKNQISVNLVAHKPGNNGTSVLAGSLISQPGQSGGSIPNLCKASDVTQSLQGADLLNATTCPSISVSSCLSDAPDPVCASLVETAYEDIDFVKLEGVPLFNLSEQLMTPASQVLYGDSDQINELVDVKHVQSGLPSKRLRTENDFAQAMTVSSTEHAGGVCGSEHKPGLARSCEKLESRNQCIKIKSDTYIDASFQKLVGNGLFDIFGVDMRNEIVDGDLENFLIDGPYADAPKLDKEASSFGNMQEHPRELCSLSEGVSEVDTFSMTGIDHLLDAVVSGTHLSSKQISDDNISCKTSLTKVSTSSDPSSSSLNNHLSMLQHVSKAPNSQKTPIKAEMSAFSSLRSGCSKDKVETCSVTDSFYGSQISSWIDQGHSIKQDNSVSTAYSKRPDGMNKPSRKRLKPGESPRPRPKDRQMIQDRLKELREIVPNGVKCSIDALLERTIKHMLFLQSVAKHSDKLKQIGEAKIISEEGRYLLKDKFERGATWAYEIGSQSAVCPIVVEDLNPPRQLLVEMLCEDRGFFLEIADIIRGLGLTILKGVMEARNDKIWARFAVEADRDVTRVEIFMSLVRLLEQTMEEEDSPLAAKDIDCKTPMVHCTLAQATSIPATGNHNILQ